MISVPLINGKQVHYRYLDHTSDLGVEIYGKDLEQLFTNAMLAIFDNITDLNRVEIKQSKFVKLVSQSIEDLFMDWLRELVFLFATDGFIGKVIEKLSITDNKLIAKISGEKFDSRRHVVKIEIKTPTYHMFEVKKDRNGYKATVIFDV